MGVMSDAEDVVLVPEPVVKSKEPGLDGEIDSQPSLMSVVLGWGGYAHRVIEGDITGKPIPKNGYSMVTRFLSGELQVDLEKKLVTAGGTIKTNIEALVGSDKQIEWLSEIDVTVGARTRKLVRQLLADAEVAEYLKTYGGRGKFANDVVMGEYVPKEGTVDRFFGENWGVFDYAKLEDMKTSEKADLLAEALKTYKRMTLGEGSMRDKSETSQKIDNLVAVQGARPDLMGLYAVDGEGDAEATEVIRRIKSHVEVKRRYDLLDALEVPEDEFADWEELTCLITTGRVGLVVTEIKTSFVDRPEEGVGKKQDYIYADVAATLAALAQLGMNAGGFRDMLTPNSDNYSRLREFVKGTLMGENVHICVAQISSPILSEDEDNGVVAKFEGKELATEVWEVNKLRMLHEVKQTAALVREKAKVG
jgi:hypothetical protein